MQQGTYCRRKGVIKQEDNIIMVGVRFELIIISHYINNNENYLMILPVSGISAGQMICAFYLHVEYYGRL